MGPVVARGEVRDVGAGCSGRAWATLERIVLQTPPAGRPAPSHRRGPPALRPGALRGDQSIVVTAASATHACAGGCRRPVEPYHFACPDCWWRLPPGIRDTITATHGRDPDSQVEAMLSAIAWYREELPRAPIGDESCIEVVWGRYDDEPESDEREAEQRVLDVARDLFTVLDAHGYQRTSDDAALGRAVVAVWQLVDEYEGQINGIACQRPDGL